MANSDVGILHLNANQTALRGQEHAVVELIGNRLRKLLEGYEIKDVVVLVQAAGDIDGRPIVMAVQAFTLASGIGNEVARAKSELIFRYVDLKTLARLFAHG